MLLRIICFQWDNTTNLFTNTETSCHTPSCTTIPKRSPSSNVTTTTTTTTATTSTSTTGHCGRRSGGGGNGGAGGEVSTNVGVTGTDQKKNYKKRMMIRC